MTPTVRPAAAARLRAGAGRHTALLVVLGLVAAGLALLVLLGRHGPRFSDPLEPGNPDADGAQALARVLEGHGVPVTIARGQSALASAAVDRDTTVFVTSTGALSEQTSRRLGALTSGAGSLVLAGATPTTIGVLGLGVDATRAWPDGAVRAACHDPLLSGLEVDVPPSTAYVPRSPGSVDTCFPTGTRGAGLVTVAPGRPSTYLVGAVRLFANGGITAGDDAAVALRLLGQHDRLVWYVADPADVPPGDAGSVRSLLPGWLGPGVVLVALTALATMMWRGRRLGPLVVEPLPVVVKAIESTAARGRLYSQARDRDHAATVLREATATRTAELLRLPSGTAVARLVPLVAAHIGRDPEAVRRLLEPGHVPDDRALTLLAQELAELEREVRQP